MFRNNTLYKKSCNDMDFPKRAYSLSPCLIRKKEECEKNWISLRNIQKTHNLFYLDLIPYVQMWICLDCQHVSPVQHVQQLYIYLKHFILEQSEHVEWSIATFPALWVERNWGYVFMLLSQNMPLHLITTMQPRVLRITCLVINLDHEHYFDECSLFLS